MKAGFAKVDITPALGIPMMGTSAAMDRPAQGVRDPLFARTLYLEHGDERALIMGFDLCFLGREGADCFKSVVGRAVDLQPRQILLNASHNHAGPALGLFYDLLYVAPQWDYLRQLDESLVESATLAMSHLSDVDIEAGMSVSHLSISRRMPRDGTLHNAPNPRGVVYESLPLCMFRDAQTQRPVCLLFAGTGHPTAMQGPQLTADYPGATMNRLDDLLGLECSLFLQGPGGDSRPRNLVSADGQRWDFSDPDKKIEEEGETLSREVIAALDNGLTSAAPALRCSLLETQWPLQPPNRAEYETILAQPVEEPMRLDVHREWAKRQLVLMERGRQIKSASVLLQGIQLAEGVRLVALEGEPVAAYGHVMERAWDGGTTFALGYTNGDALYLVTSEMLDEGGYEPESYWQYDFPAPLAKGMECVLEQGLGELQKQGIC